ncbi:MAG: glucokinase [Deltaproteobacteria bacterium]|nr:glucokinase [Deltaproteobacteria bacterium]
MQCDFQGFLLENDDRFFFFFSEGGHVDFGPVDEEQVALLSWMQQRKNPVSYELLIAGPAIGDLYDFSKEFHNMQESPGISELIRGEKDRTPVIVGGAVAIEPCPLCRKTIDLFLSILGSEAGNLALKLYALGGIYIGGGIVPRLAGRVSFSGFISSFLNKGPMSDLMSKIPVQLIMRRDAPLLGAARIGQRLWPL